jgi:Putative F0F1-ATPase subunit Ca2+/Mg2+ transporter
MGKPWLEVGRYGSVGLELVLTILIPAAIGSWLDGKYWHNAGWGAGVGFVLGAAVGFRNLVRTANGMQRDIERAEAKDPEAGRWTVDESWLHKEDRHADNRDPKDQSPGAGAGGGDEP